jgi:hypothetical protein
MKDYPKTTKEMASMIRSELTFCQSWDRGKLLGWVQWFINAGRYHAISREGSLVSVGLFRMVDDEKQCHEFYVDTGGPICYVEAAVCSERGGLRELYGMLWDDVGEFTEKIAWVRSKYDNRVLVTDMERAKRRLMRN